MTTITPPPLPPLNPPLNLYAVHSQLSGVLGGMVTTDKPTPYSDQNVQPIYLYLSIILLVTIRPVVKLH